MKSIVKTFVAILILLSNYSFAQEYTHSVKNAKKIFIKDFLGEIKIKGHSGNDLIIEADDLKEPSERAEGLKLLTASSPENTGIGLSLQETDSEIIITGVTRQAKDAEFTFLVPDGIALKLHFTNPFAYSDVHVSDFNSELEIETLNGDIILENITGPVILHSINGEINLSFSKLMQESPMSVSAINGDIDISMPESSKANFELSTIHGDIYTDLDIKVEKENENKNMKFIGGQSKIQGTLNNGGVEINVSGINGSIYLRKK